MTKSAVLCAFSLPIAFVFVLILFFSGFFMNEAEAAIVEGTIAVGHHPIGVAVNANTNKVYVTNYESGFVSVIDGFTNKIENNVKVGIFPSDIVVNPNNDKVYVAHKVHVDAPGYSAVSIVSVIDGFTNNIENDGTIAASAVKAVNPNTNRVYATPLSTAASVSVMDGSTNRVIDNVMLDNKSSDMAVNPNTNRIYVISEGHDKISVVDGLTNKVLASNIAPAYDNLMSIAVNPNTNRVYATSLGSSPHPPLTANPGFELPVGLVLVIDGSTNRVISNIPVVSPSDIAVNANTNRVYVSNSFSDSIYTIDGSTNRVIESNAITVGNFPQALSVNPNTNRVYVANSFSDTVSVIFDP